MTCFQIIKKEENPSVTHHRTLLVFPLSKATNRLQKQFHVKIFESTALVEGERVNLQLERWLLMRSYCRAPLDDRTSNFDMPGFLCKGKCQELVMAVCTFKA